MTKYNPCSSQHPDCSSESNCASGSFRGQGKFLPFFDIPCLYHPQYPRCSSPYPNPCEGAFAVYRVSGAANGDKLTLTQDIQCGRSIRLQSDTGILLQPNRLYQISYHVNAKAEHAFSVCPIEDGAPDESNISYSAGPSNTGSMQSVSNTFLLPVVDTASLVEFQMNLASAAYPDWVNGNVCILLVSRL